MKKYLSFFRLRFLMGLQYRAAAAAGVLTQFAWGFMEIMMYRAFYRADAAAFPMSFEATASYIWLQQAFLAVFAAWMLESEIFDAIKNGGLAYELCRPIRIYNMWFARSAANRLSRAALRCMPILIAAAFVPRPYGLSLPASPMHFFLFLITLCTGLAVTVSFSMLIYMLTFFTISPQGVQILFTSCVEFLAGAIVPIPFFPEKIGRILELLPFASMQNVPLRIYSGSMSLEETARAAALQIAWLIVITALGKWLCWTAIRRVTVQGG